MQQQIRTAQRSYLHLADVTSQNSIDNREAEIHSTYNLCAAVKSTPPSQRSTSSTTLRCRWLHNLWQLWPENMRVCVTLPRTSLALTHVLHNGCFFVCVCLRLRREQKSSACGCIQTRNVHRSRSVRSRALKSVFPATHLKESSGAHRLPASESALARSGEY